MNEKGLRRALTHAAGLVLFVLCVPFKALVVSEPFSPIDRHLVLGATMVCFVDLDSATRKLLLQFQTSFQCFNKNSICRSNFSVDFDNIGFRTQNIFFQQRFP